MKRASLLAAVALASLELVHPASPDGAVTSTWVPLHVALVALYLLLTWTLWHLEPPGALVRIALLCFAVANSAFLTIDGLLVGLRAPSDPASANALWNSSAVTVLADVTGAAWSLSLLAFAAPPIVILGIVWLAFLSTIPLLSRTVAIVAVAWLAYRGGGGAIPTVLLVFASVLRQHVGPEAALGLLLVAGAIAWPKPSRAGSGPAAASPPEAASPP